MKIYKTQAEVEKDIKDGELVVEGDVRFECSISICASLRVSGNINALDINALDINAGNINAGDIVARNIDARDINARNINALDINAGNILYYAFCCVYKSIICFSIKAKRDKSHPPICLDGELKFKDKPDSLVGSDVEVKVNGKTYKAKIVG